MIRRSEALFGQEHDLGSRALKAGRHVPRFEGRGRNAQSSGSALGPDRVRLRERCLTKG